MLCSEPNRNKNHVAIIAAAGSFHQFQMPRSLLKLNGETVIERLVRQLREARVQCLVGRGQAGAANWTEEHVQEFQKLPCEVLASAAPVALHSLATVRFLLSHLQENRERYKLRGQSKIYIIHGDYIFADSLLEEFLAYPAPNIYEFKRTDTSMTLTWDVLDDFMRISQLPYHALIAVARTEKKRFCEKLGFVMIKHREYKCRFMEVDHLEELEWAHRMVIRWETKGSRES